MQENTASKKITVEVEVKVPVEKAWESYTDPKHIVGWNFASDDWHCPRATSDLRVGGSFSSRMESKDGKQGFDFGGVYDEVVPGKWLAYTFGGRRAEVLFEEAEHGTKVTISFDPETENPPEMQKNGWQAILDNFKRYAEAA